MRDQGVSTEPLFEAIDGPVLVELGNWVVESLETSGLENEQVLLLFMLLVRGMDALRRHFPEVLMPMMARIAQEMDLDEE